jgi:hypothetical protein
MLSDDAKAQVARLSGRRGWPNLDQNGVDELVRALAESCRDAEQGENVVTAWNRTNEWVPQPSELWDLSRDFPPRKHEYAGCKRCGGSGFCLTRFIRTRRPGQPKPTYDRLEHVEPDQALAQWDALQDGQDIVETSGHCACNKGQHMKNESLRAEALKSDLVEKAVEKRLQKKAQWEANRT